MDLPEILYQARINHKEHGDGTVVYCPSAMIQVQFDDGNTGFFPREDVGPTREIKCLSISPFALDLESRKKTEDFDALTRYHAFEKELFPLYRNHQLFFDLLMNILPDSGLQRILKSNASRIIRKFAYGSSSLPTKEEKAIVLAVLSLVSLKRYDGDLWSYVRNELTDLYGDGGEPNPAIDSTIRFLIYDPSLNEPHQISNALVHSAIPLAFIKKFFDFVLAIYECNFDCSLEGVVLEDYLKPTIEGLSVLFKFGNLGNDDFSLNATKKTYTLVRSTKVAFINFPADMTKILAVFLHLIDDWFHDPVHLKFVGNYPPDLVARLLEWRTTAKKVLSLSPPRSTLPSKVTFLFNTQSQSIGLIFPVFVLPGVSEKELSFIRVLMTSGKETTILKLNEHYSLTERIGYFSIRIFPFFLSHPLSQIKFEICLQQRVLISTEETLFRDYLIFNDEGNEIKNRSDYQGAAYVVINIEDKLDGKNILFDQHKVVILNADPEKVYVLEKSNPHGIIQICFTSMSKPGIYGTLIDNVICMHEKRKLKVFQSLIAFVFESKFSLDKLTFGINDTKTHLDQSYGTSSLIRGSFLHRISLTKFSFHNNLNTLRVFSSDGKEIKTETFILDSLFSFTIQEYEKPLVYNVCFSSSFLKEGRESKKVDFCSVDNPSIDFALGFDRLRYIANSEIVRFRLKEDDLWQPMGDIEIEKNDVLYISSPIEKVEVKNNDNQVIINDLPHSTDHFITAIDIKDLRQFDVNNTSVKLHLLLYEKPSIPMTVYLRPTVLGHTILQQDEGTIKFTFDIKCFSKGELSFSLIDSRGQTHFSCPLSQKSITLRNLSPFASYHIVISELPDMFIRTEPSEIYHVPLTIFDFRHLATRVLRIRQLVYWKNHSEEIFRVRPTAIEFLKRIQDPNELPEGSHLRIGYPCYFCRFLKITPDNQLIPYQCNQKVLVEVVGEPLSKNLSLTFEYDDADGVGFSLGTNRIEECYNNHNLPIDHIEVDCEKDQIT